MEADIGWVGHVFQRIVNVVKVVGVSENVVVKQNDQFPGGAGAGNINKFFV